MHSNRPNLNIQARDLIKKFELRSDGFTEITSGIIYGEIDKVEKRDAQASLVRKEAGYKTRELLAQRHARSSSNRPGVLIFEVHLVPRSIFELWQMTSLFT